jgi:outer membrane protein assembly factor BamB
LIEMQQLPQRASRTIILLLACRAADHLAAADWPRLRGPNGSGIAETVRSGGNRTRRQRSLEDGASAGKSSPVVTADRIYVTGHENGKLSTLALERATGKIIWRREAPGHRGEKRNPLNDAAAPTPVTDGNNL